MTRSDEFSENYYCFPALVQVEHPTDVWQSSGSGCGWCLQCSKEGQHLTPWFLHDCVAPLPWPLTAPSEMKPHLCWDEDVLFGRMESNGVIGMVLRPLQKCQNRISWCYYWCWVQREKRWRVFNFVLHISQRYWIQRKSFVLGYLPLNCWLILQTYPATLSLVQVSSHSTRWLIKLLRLFENTSSLQLI